MFDSCKGCALTAKAQATTCKSWLKTVQPWQRIHFDFTGPLDDQYYLIVVDSHTKSLEVQKCKRLITNCTIGFLQELFARFSVFDCVVTDNRTQFTSNHHHHHVAPPARISLTVSRHFSLSFIASGRSSGLQPVSSHSCCM